MTPRISIIVTCYNLGEYLHEALQSIERYNGPATYEVIIVDDGSTDPRTRDVIAGLDRRKYRVLEQKNMGLAKARNNGIALSTGDYIISLDADNRLHRAFLERATDILDAEPEVGIVYGDAMYFEGRSGLWKVGPYDLPRLLKSNYIDACACYRRTLWQKVGGYDEHMPHMGWEDWDFWLRCTVAGAEFRYVPEVFFDYRVRAGSMIVTTRKHSSELTAYILSKPALRFLAPLRERLMRLERSSTERMSTKELIDLLGDRAKAKLGKTFKSK